MLRRIVCLTALVLVPMVAPAQNLFVNPNFDINTAGWTSLAGGFTWNPDDADGSPSSGSAHGFQTEFGAVLTQCVPVTDLNLYSTGASFRRVAGTSTTAEVHMLFLATTDCTGPDLDHFTFSGPLSTSWGSVSGTATAPVGSQSAMIWLIMTFATFADEVHIDNARMSNALFADDFESASPWDWSSVVGEPACAHDLCTAGGPLSAACDPCVSQVCAVDSFCCTTGWDLTCINLAISQCGISCP